jgi:hypothetical protein
MYNPLQLIEASAIESFVTLTGNHRFFSRVVAEIERIERSMPHSTGPEKRAKFLAEAHIIFDDLVIPIGETILRLFLELGVVYLAAQVPALAVVAGVAEASVDKMLSEDIQARTDGALK